MKPLTETQQSVLDGLSTKEFRFPPPRRERTCEALQDLGLVESQLQISARNYARGTATFKRAYRRLESK